MASPPPTFGRSPREIEERLAEWILPQHLRSLERRLAPDADRYEMLGIAGIVRSLLLDSATVESLARRRRSLPAPRFSYAPYVPKSGAVLHGLHNVEDDKVEVIFAVADEAFVEPRVDTGLREFLKAPVAQLYGSPVTVSQFVRAYAHVLGGVHLGVPKSDTERLLHAATAHLTDAVLPWSRTLQHIGTVTLRALRPLTYPE